MDTEEKLKNCDELLKSSGESGGGGTFRLWVKIGPMVSEHLTGEICVFTAGVISATASTVQGKWGPVFDLLLFMQIKVTNIWAAQSLSFDVAS